VLIGSARAVRPAPRQGGTPIFKYRLHSVDGDDLSESVYAVVIKPGDEIHAKGGEKLRARVVAFEGDDHSLAGMLEVEAA
jgi:hypothetical protein